MSKNKPFKLLSNIFGMNSNILCFFEVIRDILNLKKGHSQHIKPEVCSNLSLLDKVFYKLQYA